MYKDADENKDKIWVGFHFQKLNEYTVQVMESTQLQCG